MTNEQIARMAESPPPPKTGIEALSNEQYILRILYDLFLRHGETRHVPSNKCRVGFIDLANGSKAIELIFADGENVRIGRI